MSDNDEKRINLEDLESDTTSFQSEPNKIEEKAVDLDEIPTEKQIKSNQNPAKRLTRQSNSSAKKINKLFVTKIFGVKELSSNYFVKPIVCLLFALVCAKALMDLNAVEHPNDELMAFGYSIIATPMTVALYALIAILIIFALYFFAIGKSIIYRDDFFVISYDGLEGVDSVIPVGKTFYRRKIKWSDISRCQIFAEAKIPYVEIHSAERKLIEIPLYVTELKNLQKTLEEFCPVNNPIRLIINKFKKA